jgi:aldose sugar dehydrogenase
MTHPRSLASSLARSIGRVLALAVVASSMAIVGIAPPVQAGTAINAVLVKGGLNGPAGFTFLPDGRIIYLERGTGRVRILNPTTNAERQFFTIKGVDGSGERGALGVAVDPRWPQEPFVYVYVTRQAGGRLRNEIVRIRARNGHGVGMHVLMSAPASADPYHNGGRILFGPDHRLYAIVGDGHDSANAQDRVGNLRGKMLRLRTDGGIPAGNPTFGGKRSRVYAFGIRNSFGFAFDPLTDRLWETENGPGCNDEVNLIRARGNYAWGSHEACPNTNRDGPAPRRRPKLVFPDPIGITGATFCDGCGLAFEGDLFFGSCCPNGTDSPLHRAVLNAGRSRIVNVVNVAPLGVGAIYSMETAPDGRIFFSNDTGIYRLA